MLQKRWDRRIFLKMVLHDQRNLGDTIMYFPPPFFEAAEMDGRWKKLLEGTRGLVVCANDAMCL